MAAITAHARGTQAHPHAKLFPQAKRTGPRQCLRGTCKSISDMAVVIWLELPWSHDWQPANFLWKDRRWTKPWSCKRDVISALEGFLNHSSHTQLPAIHQLSPSRWDRGMLHLRLMLWALLLQWEGFRVSCISQEKGSSSPAALLLPHQDTCVLPLSQGWQGTGRGPVSSAHLQLRRSFCHFTSPPGCCHLAEGLALARERQSQICSQVGAVFIQRERKGGKKVRCYTHIN